MGFLQDRAEQEASQTQGDVTERGPQHCNGKICKSYKNTTLHLVGKKGFMMPWPLALHIEVEPAWCMCECPDCEVVNDAHRANEAPATKKAVAAYRGGRTKLSNYCGPHQCHKIIK